MFDFLSQNLFYVAVLKVRQNIEFGLRWEQGGYKISYNRPGGSGSQSNAVSSTYIWSENLVAESEAKDGGN